MKKLRPIKAWALFEGDEMICYYRLWFIPVTKDQAKIDLAYYNGKLGHKYRLQRVEIKAI